MFVIYKDGKPFVQACGKQVMDVNDKKTEIPPEVAPIINTKQMEARKIRAAATLKRRQAETARKIAAGEMKEPTGKFLTTTYGAKIGYDVLIDSGKGYYYLGIGRLAQPRRVSGGNNSGLKNLLGLYHSVRPPLPTPSNPRQHKQNFSLYHEILTVNKENVASLGDQPQPAARQQTPKPSFMSRLGSAFGY